ncbi:MAG: DciA family protein [Microbacteriaceae bacterium]
MPSGDDEETEALPSETQEAVSVYLRFKRLFGEGHTRHAARKTSRRQSMASTVPFGSGRDPRGIGSVVEALTTELGWTSPLAQSELLASWSSLAGEETARHSTPIGITDDVLTVQCQSTAWATQLRIMRSEILKQIALRYPNAGIQSIRFEGPDAPSWKRGPRSIPGRGPRDTYG